MKKLLLLLVIGGACSVMANYSVQIVGFPECPDVAFSKDEVKSIKPDNSPCVYGTEMIMEWTDGIIYVDNEDHTAAIPMQVDSHPVPVGEKCFSCDISESFLIRPVVQEDGTFLDEKICPERELLPYEKCSALRVSKLREQK